MSINLQSHGYWLDSCPEASHTSSSLSGGETADVCIIGGGFSGLWTAYYLKKAEPALDIAIVEAREIGFGASGKNGGWVQTELEGMSRLMRKSSPGEVGELLKLLPTAAKNIGQFGEEEGHNIDFAQGGVIVAALNESQRTKLEDELALYRQCNLGEDHCRWLDQSDSREFVKIPESLGSFYAPDFAAVHPLKLCRALAAVLSDMGVRIYENTPVTHYHQSVVSTIKGTISAGHIVVSTEAYTDSIQGMERKVTPLHSFIVATEPLSEKQWSDIGLAQRTVFGDASHITTYGQRSADNRIVFGSGIEYPGGSTDTINGDCAAYHWGYVISELRRILPQLKDVNITHRWTGCFGVTRNDHPHVHHSNVKAITWCGGYVGRGVCASNLVGEINRDLILKKNTHLTRTSFIRESSDIGNIKEWSNKHINSGMLKSASLLMKVSDSLNKHPAVPTPISRELSRFVTYLHDNG